MANNRNIKQKINSVKTTQKITKAMKLVAVSKLKRVQNSVNNANVFIERIENLINSLSYSIKDVKSRFLFSKQKEEKEKKVAILAFSADKGLCGGLNSGINKSLKKFYDENYKKGIETFVYTVGKKVTSYAKKKKNGMSHNLIFSQIDFYQDELKKNCRELSSKLIEDYLDNKFDELFILYTHFTSAISNNSLMYQVLPFKLEDKNEEKKEDIKDEDDIKKFKNAYKFDEDKELIVDELIKKYLVSLIFYNATHSFASEIGSRMVAMGSATDNAEAIINTLTIQYNKVRQAGITQQIAEIAGAAAVVQ
jgi:F-type H+-transporting ATPase subunit gamma